MPCIDVQDGMFPELTPEESEDCSTRGGNRQESGHFLITVLHIFHAVLRIDLVSLRLFPAGLLGVSDILDIS